MEEFLGKISGNQSLIDILTQYFFRSTPTHFALGYFYVYLDYFYPKSGTNALPELLEAKLLDQGGKLKLNTRIAEIIPAENRVVDSEGGSYHYDNLIWAADLKTLYKNLDPQGLDPSIKDKIETAKGQMLASHGAESVFILFMGVNRPLSYFRERGGEHMFFSPSKKGLGELHRRKRAALLKDFDHKSKAEIIQWLEDFCDYNSYEVSVPALRDAALAPNGQTGVMISCLFDYDLFVKVQEAGWYDEFKDLLEERIIRNFSQTIYQGFADDILFKYSSTPLTINKVSGSSEGAITGWSFEADVPVIDQLKDIPKSVLTPIPGVLQAGQWSYVPSGVPIAMLTGWYATQKIIKR